MKKMISKKYYIVSMLLSTFFCMQSYDISLQKNNHMHEIMISLDVLRNKYSLNEHENYITQMLHTVRNLHNEIENVSHWFDRELLEYVITHLVEMYRKIVEIILNYYVDSETISEKELQDKIITIISQDITDIIDYLCRQFIATIFDPYLSWQERICHCAWILSIILIIKTSIEEIPYVFNLDLIKRKINYKIEEITLCLKAKIDICE